MYYDKLLEFSFSSGDIDPFTEFLKTYTIYDAIVDIAKVWDDIPEILIQKCFENVFDQDLFIEERNEKCNVSDSWTGINIRGFDNNNIEVDNFNLSKVKAIENLNT